MDPFGNIKEARFYPEYLIQPFIYDDLTEDGLVVVGFEDPYLDIYIAEVEASKMDLACAVREELRFLIDEYYFADDSTLSPEAIKLKNKLRARITIGNPT
jgi:hypothetical protein